MSLIFSCISLKRSVWQKGIKRWRGKSTVTLAQLAGNTRILWMKSGHSIVDNNRRA